MVRCGAPGQMSVLHGICCVTGCLNWKPAHNISTRCQSSDYPLVSANTHTHTHTHTLFWLFFVIVLSLALCFFCFSVTHWCPLFCLPTSVNTQRRTHTHARTHTTTHTYRHADIMSCHSWCCVTGRLTADNTQSRLTVSVLSLFSPLIDFVFSPLTLLEWVSAHWHRLTFPQQQPSSTVQNVLIIKLPRSNRQMLFVDCFLNRVKEMI